MIKHLITFGLLFLVSGCSWLTESQLARVYGEEKAREMMVASEARAEQVTHYHHTVQPLLESRCAVCHGCYDAPCQMKMDSSEAMLRGASKDKVYNGTRLLSASLSRMFEDADNTAKWREKGFYPVLNERDGTANNNREVSIMWRLLALKNQHPLPEQDILGPEFTFALDRANQCPKLGELESYEKKFPLWGMPYALPGLTETEFTQLDQWFEWGAPIFHKPAINSSIANQVTLWEQRFNGSSLKEQLINRYLYEHLFLSNLYFVDASIGTTQTEYFKLVRSKTPPGQPIERISSRRPFDDPGLERVYYRLWRDPQAVLLKTHIPFALSEHRWQKWQRWFYQADFDVAQLPSYAPEVAANPFISFSDLPVNSRYRFLLDEAQKTIMNFIKGPVCRGQMALNVIQDRFWVVFVDPDVIRADHKQDFLTQNSEFMRLPVERTGDFSHLVNWMGYANKQRHYLKARAAYVQRELNAMPIVDTQLIWDGHDDEGVRNDNAALTIYRHFDSATVLKGLNGEPPKTAWLIGYSLLERIHYLLVAGFDVYGNAGHQLTTRLYMDFLRMEGEMNFLELLPATERDRLISHWYRDADKSVLEYVQGYRAEFPVATSIDYLSQEPMSELLDLIRQRLGDSVNTDHSLADAPLPVSELLSLRQLDFVQSPAASLMPESAVLWVKPYGLYTLARTSAHSNIASLFGEQSRRLPQEDQLSVIRGLGTSYPDVFFHLEAKQLGQFVESLRQMKTSADYKSLLDDYAVRRTHPDFWEFSDQLHREFEQQYPEQSGWLDYNRLENR